MYWHNNLEQNYIHRAGLFAILYESE